MEIETEAEPGWMHHPELLPAQPLLGDQTPRWQGTHLVGATPPGKGLPTRRQNTDRMNIEHLDRIFATL